MSEPCKLNWLTGTLAFAGFCFIVNFGIRAVSPSDLWLTVPKMDIESAIYGQPIIVNYEREVHRDTQSTRQSILEKAVPGGWTQECESAPVDRNYRMGEAVDRPVLLTDFVSAECADLKPGDYRLIVRWVINPRGLRGVLYRHNLEVSDRFSVVEEKQ